MEHCTRGAVTKVTASRERVAEQGDRTVHLQLGGREVRVTATKPRGSTLILGTDGIKTLRGVALGDQSGVRFPAEEEETCAAPDIMTPHDKQRYGLPAGLFLLTANIQHRRTTVQSVMDFRELNTQIDAFSALTDRWRGDNKEDTERW